MDLKDGLKVDFNVIIEPKNYIYLSAAIIVPVLLYVVLLALTKKV